MDNTMEGRKMLKDRKMTKIEKAIAICQRSAETESIAFYYRKKPEQATIKKIAQKYRQKIRAKKLAPDLPHPYYRSAKAAKNYILTRRADRIVKRLGLWTLDDAETSARLICEQLSIIQYPIAQSRGEWDVVCALKARKFVGYYRKVACDIGKRLAPNTTSKYATVEYGFGGAEQIDYPYKGKARGFARRWHEIGRAHV